MPGVPMPGVPALVHHGEDVNRRFFYEEEKAVWKSGHSRFANGPVHGPGRFGIRGDPVQRSGDRGQEPVSQGDLPGFAEIERVEDLFPGWIEKDDPV